MRSTNYRRLTAATLLFSLVCATGAAAAQEDGMTPEQQVVAAKEAATIAGILVAFPGTLGDYEGVRANVRNNDDGDLVSAKWLANKFINRDKEYVADELEYIIKLVELIDTYDFRYVATMIGAAVEIHCEGLWNVGASVQPLDDELVAPPRMESARRAMALFGVSLMFPDGHRALFGDVEAFTDGYSSLIWESERQALIDLANDPVVRSVAGHALRLGWWICDWMGAEAKSWGLWNLPPHLLAEGWDVPPPE